MFYSVLHRSLNNKSSSRPRKIELKGVLVSCSKTMQGNIFRFKLETGSKEYLLLMNKTLLDVAEKLDCEEVTVKGYLDLETNVIDVEKINRSKINDPARITSLWLEPYFEIENYKRAIKQRGKLEPYFEELVT